MFITRLKPMQRTQTHGSEALAVMHLAFNLGNSVQLRAGLFGEAIRRL